MVGPVGPGSMFWIRDLDLVLLPYNRLAAIFRRPFHTQTAMLKTTKKLGISGVAPITPPPGIIRETERLRGGHGRLIPDRH